jgi:hypothetical protein
MVDRPDRLEPVRFSSLSQAARLVWLDERPDIGKGEPELFIGSMGLPPAFRIVGARPQGW